MFRRVFFTTAAALCMVASTTGAQAGGCLTGDRVEVRTDAVVERTDRTFRRIDDSLRRLGDRLNRTGDRLLNWTHTRSRS
jgi:hypothetical protein